MALDEIKRQVVLIMKSIRENKPLIHCISNYVSINDCANILLAIGAKPIMADAIDEVGEIQCYSSSLVINMGMISYEKIETIIEAGKIANKLSVPVILDPVGINVSSFRKNAVLKIMKKVKVNIIRGNVAEILTLCEKKTFSKGVDSLDNITTKESKEVVEYVSSKYNAICIMTGETDYISEGDRTVIVENGDKMLSYVTGAGCMTSALVGAFVSSADDLFIASIGAVMVMGLAGEIALQNLRENEGSGTYRTRLIDAVFNMKQIDIIQRGRVNE